MRPRLTRIIEEKKSAKYPGYPFYVSSDDMENKIEKSKTLANELSELNESIPKKEKDLDEESIGEPILPLDEHAVNEEDLLALGSKDLSMDGGDDELLAQRTTPVDFSGRDLDVPGTELDDDSEKVGSEDEENNSYSLGGEEHQDLEESKP